MGVKQGKLSGIFKALTADFLDDGEDGRYRMEKGSKALIGVFEPF